MWSLKQSGYLEQMTGYLRLRRGVWVIRKDGKYERETDSCDAGVSLRLTWSRGVGVCWDGGKGGQMEWILICLLQEAMPPPTLLPCRPHGGLECVENSADGVAQTKHTLCWWVTDGVSRHSHGSLQRRLHGNKMWRRLTAGDLSCGRSGLSGC